MRPVDGVADQTRAKSMLDFRQIPLFIEKGIQVKEMALWWPETSKKKNTWKDYWFGVFWALCQRLDGEIVPTWYDEIWLDSMGQEKFFSGIGKSSLRHSLALCRMRPCWDEEGRPVWTTLEPPQPRFEHTQRTHDTNQQQHSFSILSVSSSPFCSIHFLYFRLWWRI